MDWIQGHEAEIAILFGLAMSAGGIIVKLTPTKRDDAWWQWLMSLIGRKPVMLIALLPLLGCQTTRMDEDGSIMVMSWGDVKVAACGSLARDEKGQLESLEAALEATELDQGVVAPNPTPSCLVIHEGGMSAIFGNTLGELFKAIIALMPRGFP